MSPTAFPSLVAAALLIGLGIAHAQTAQEHLSHHPDAATPAQTSPAKPRPQGGMAMNRMMGGSMEGMMPMMRMMHGMGGEMGMMPGEHVEGRIAFLKAELRITEAQLPQWNAFADAQRDSAARMRSATEAMRAGTPDNLPARLDAREAMMSARLEGLKATAAAVKSLYAVLDDAQKKLADELIMSPMGGM